MRLKRRSHRTQSFSFLLNDKELCILCERRVRRYLPSYFCQKVELLTDKTELLEKSLSLPKLPNPARRIIMTQHRVYHSFLEAKQQGLKRLAVLIDPDKMRLGNVGRVIELAARGGADYFFVGG